MCDLTGDGLSRLGRRGRDCRRLVIRCCSEDNLGGSRYVMLVIPVVFFVFGCSACIDAFCTREHLPLLHSKGFQK